MALVTSAQFRLDFPEFANVTTYPNGSADFWLAVAEKLVNADRWGDLTSLGVELFAAHNLVIEAQNMQAAAFNKFPGLMNGVLTSKSVDKVSAGYDSSSATIPGAGHWNLTTFGTRYQYLVGLFGAGAVQIGIPNGGCASAAAWPGPLTGPW